MKPIWRVSKTSPAIVRCLLQKLDSTATEMEKRRKPVAWIGRYERPLLQVVPEHLPMLGLTNGTEAARK
jgi:hypothetical protein